MKEPLYSTPFYQIDTSDIYNSYLFSGLINSRRERDIALLARYDYLLLHPIEGIKRDKKGRVMIYSVFEVLAGEFCLSKISVKTTISKITKEREKNIRLKELVARVQFFNLPMEVNNEEGK